MIPLIIATVLNISYPTYSVLPLKTEWESLGENIEYELQYSYTEDFKYIEISHWPTTNTYEYTYHLENSFYCRRLRYKYFDMDDYYYKNLDCFFFDKSYTPPPMPDTSEEIPTPTIPPVEKRSIPTEIYEDPRIVDIPKVKGVQENKHTQCILSILKKNTYSIQSFDCDLGISITNTKYLDWNTYFSLSIEGTYKKEVSVETYVYECKPFSLLDFETWGKCKQILIEKKLRTLPLIYYGYIEIDGVSQKNYSFSFKDTSFFLNTTFKNDILTKKVKILFNLFLSFKRDTWVDLIFTKKIPIDVQKATVAVKPFSFPLDRYLGVTQWYGCTKYQCPHKGIDFGAKLNKVVSIGDGTVVNVGYDKYGGECNQGGNFVILKHSNGMYSTYFHLNSYSVNVGDSVKRNQVLGISGNSGKWNCQNLGYHLHFETRKGLSSSTHSNPVEYIEVDWNMIPTIGKDIFPDRLSGENPHPNF